MIDDVTQAETEAIVASAIAEAAAVHAADVAEARDVGLDSDAIAAVAEAEARKAESHDQVKIARIQLENAAQSVYELDALRLSITNLETRISGLESSIITHSHDTVTPSSPVVVVATAPGGVGATHKEREPSQSEPEQEVKKLDDELVEAVEEPIKEAPRKRRRFGRR